MTAPPSIRRARKADLDDVGRLWIALLEEHAGLDPRFEVALDALDRWVNDYAHWLQDERQRVYVAEQQGQVVGFVRAEQWAPLPIYGESLEVYINEIYIAGPFRGKGLGSDLLDHVTQWASTLKADRLRLGMLAANAEGRRFWERQGASPLSVTYTIEFEKQEEVSTEKKGRLGF